VFICEKESLVTKLSWGGQWYVHTGLAGLYYLEVCVSVFVPLLGHSKYWNHLTTVQLFGFYALN